MAPTDRHLVVDGSNIATEGRTVPSLAQLGEAVRAVRDEFPRYSVTVIVDATFAHRIEASERKAFEAKISAGEIVAPPSGVVGRGDAFILQVAEKAGAVVLSNDSFQEFHGEHEWLFDKGRLIGGKPIEGVGWIFVERNPVRGATSRRAVRDTTPGKTTTGKTTAAGRSATGKSTVGKSAVLATKKQRGAGPKTNPASTKPAKNSKTAGTKSAAGPEELNDARTFVGFVSRYSIGDEVEGTIEQFSSHGCYLRADSARCYLPSQAMGDPPPSRARDVVTRGQDVIVRVESLDSDRRGINVSLVRAVSPDGGRRRRDGNSKPGSVSRATRLRRQNPAKPSQQPAVTADESAGEGQLTRSKRTVATKKTAKKTARKQPSATARTTKKAATATTSVRAQKAVARRAAKKTAAASKSTATKTTKAPTGKASKKAAPAKAATRKSTKKATTKATAKKTTTPRKAASTKATAKKPAPTKAATKKASAKKAASKKAGTKATKKGAAKKTTAAKAATKKSGAVKAATKKTATKAAGKKTASKATSKKAPAGTTKKAAAKKST